ncbi:hypothetical protein Tco_0385988 [Tanacetum coccineum]
MSNPTSKPSNASLVKIEAPKELPKVSLVNESLKKLKFYLARFDNVVKIRTTPDARTEDVLLTVMNSMSLIGESVNMDRKRNESCDKCSNLKVELLKSQNACRYRLAHPGLVLQTTLTSTVEIIKNSNVVKQGFTTKHSGLH